MIFAQDFSKVDFSKLSPEQIEMYKKYASANKLSNSAMDNISVEERKAEFDSIFSDFIKKDDRIFGSYLFNSQKLTFEPKLNIPTPINYILGAYDELLIDVSGLHEANYKLKVSPEGNVRVPNVGPIKVAGRTIEEATKRLKNEMMRYFQGVQSGETKIVVSLGNIRSIQIAIVGEAVRPGTYTLPSLATAFNALYACGGPNKIGSYRSINVIRAGKIISTLDVYGMLVEGLKVNDVPLKDNDIIRIEPYITRAKVEGAVKRPSIFETISGEPLQKVLDFAGGFTDNAQKSLVRVFRYINNSRAVIDVVERDFNRFFLQTGDSVFVSNISEHIKGYTVTISGAVRNQGRFSLSENQTLKELLLNAQGFTEMALVDSVEIIRTVKDQNLLKNSQQKSSVIKVKVDKELKGNDAAFNTVLENDDHVIVRLIPGYEDVEIVRIEGEVIFPGDFNILSKSERVSDIITRAGGLSQFAYPNGAFLIRNEKKEQMEQKLDKFKKSNTIKSFESSKNKSIDLKALKANGLNSLTDLSAMDTITNKFSNKLDDILDSEDIVGLDLELIMSNKGGKEDLFVKEGDNIYIPRRQQTVRVIGQVLFPTIISFDENLQITDYILKSGGFAENANKKSIFVLNANGSVNGMKHFLFFKSYPKVQPGASIVVSEKPIKLTNKLSVGETIGMLTSTASLMVLIYSVLK
jgi:protein involved in polysaccharide export with SLBB domain